jgi:hypothetical protein
MTEKKQMGMLIDLQVGESIELKFDEQTIKILIEMKNGKKARLRVIAPPCVGIVMPKK